MPPPEPPASAPGPGAVEGWWPRRRLYGPAGSATLAHEMVRVACEQVEQPGADDRGVIADAFERPVDGEARQCDLHGVGAADPRQFVHEALVIEIEGA